MADSKINVTNSITHTSGEVFVKLVDNLDGTHAISTSAALSATDNAVLDDIAANQTDGTQTTQISSAVPGTGATNLGKAEDAVHGSGDVGIEILAVRKDTASGLSADGDYHVLEVNASGQLHVAPTGQLGYRSSDSTYQPIRLDRATNSIQTIEYDHHEIHASSSFTCHFNNDVTNIGEQTAIAFSTPNTTNWIHIVCSAYASGASYFSIYEVADLDLDEGTDLTIFNRDRNSATASTVKTIETSPEAGKATSYTEAQLSGATLSTATEIERKYIGTAGKGGIGGEGRGVAEIILKQNTQYCFCLTSLVADDVIHNITLDWYEHTNIA